MLLWHFIRVHLSPEELGHAMRSSGLHSSSKDSSTSITKGDSGGNGNSCSCGEGDSRGTALTSGHGIVLA